VVSGAGIAGPTLAYWLTHTGHDVLLVERAPALRTGGYVVDFWGAGYEIAEKMGLRSRVMDMGYQVREVRFVDRQGRTVGSFSAGVFRGLLNGRFTSLRRSDLSAAISSALTGSVDTIFGDSMTALDERDGGVRVLFEHAPPQQVDLVIGADGLHSRTRQFAFGPESNFEAALGYHVAAFELEGYQPRDELVYVSHAVPGRQISRFAMRGDKTLFLFVFRDEYLAALDTQQALDPTVVLNRVFGDVGWECPQILAALPTVPDVYFDSVSQIRMDHWSHGRTALVGDAAACVSLLAGEGTGLAMAEAYVLAGTLHRHSGDYRQAFAEYERTLLPLLRRKQASAAKFASSFVPKTSVGIAFRNRVTRLLRIPFIAEYFIGRDLRDDLALPDYGISPAHRWL
jgi:2-polyprenyl-6-methoxyphenol hydroxylase-like FAD-dependent oxidoreductase